MQYSHEELIFLESEPGGKREALIFEWVRLFKTIDCKNNS